LPYYSLREKWTPLKWIGIRIYIDTNSQEIWIKAWHFSRKRLKLGK
jgi:hypothetical protein